MKKHLLAFALLLFLLAQTKAQTSVYHPFPDSNAVWNVSLEIINGCGGPYRNLVENYSYVLNGDTSINAVQYHKLYIPYVDTPNCRGFHVAGYVGGIRQEIINRKVFFISPYDTLEGLLYDFNIKIGDTIPMASCPANIWVTGIDSILIGANYRKQWKLNVSTTIIEGIGFDFDLFESACNGIGIFSDGYLMCFKQNGSALYPDSTTACNIINGENQIREKKYIIQISPNPATKQLTIHQPYMYKNENANIFITNVLGLKTSSPTSLLEKRGETTIDISMLPPGVYFVQVIREKERWIGSFVKE